MVCVYLRSVLFVFLSLFFFFSNWEQVLARLFSAVCVASWNEADKIVPRISLRPVADHLSLTRVGITRGKSHTLHSRIPITFTFQKNFTTFIVHQTHHSDCEKHPGAGCTDRRLPSTQDFGWLLTRLYPPLIRKKQLQLHRKLLSASFAIYGLSEPPPSHRHLGPVPHPGCSSWMRLALPLLDPQQFNWWSCANRSCTQGREITQILVHQKK